MLALACGIIYLLKGYSKGAAIYYKVFMLLTAVSSVILSTAFITGFAICGKYADKDARGTK